LYACIKATGGTGWADEPDGRRWYTIWGPDEFVETVSQAGFEIERVDRGSFVEVYATRRE
jgi:hypothetical protein